MESTPQPCLHGLGGGALSGCPEPCDGRIRGTFEDLEANLALADGVHLGGMPDVEPALSKRAQVRDGRSLLRRMLGVMMSNPPSFQGRPFYPVVADS